MLNEWEGKVEDDEAEVEKEEADLGTPSRSAFYVIYLLLGLFCVCFSFSFLISFLVYFWIISLMVFKFYDLANKWECGQASIDKIVLGIGGYLRVLHASVATPQLPCVRHE